VIVREGGAVGHLVLLAVEHVVIVLLLLREQRGSFREGLENLQGRGEGEGEGSVGPMMEGGGG
jgi:hypothetical protein